MKPHVLMILMMMCALLASCAHDDKLPSLEEVTDEELGSDIIKTPGRIIEVHNRVVRTDSLLRSKTLASETSDLAKRVARSSAASKNGKVEAFASLTALVIGKIDEGSRQSSYRAQELTFKPSNGGKTRCFIQLIYKETGPIELGCRGRLVQYPASGYFRFEPLQRDRKSDSGKE